MQRYVILLALLAISIGSLPWPRAAMEAPERQSPAYALPALVVSNHFSGTARQAAAPGTATSAVTRGPYLQQGTPTSIVVRWRTDAATRSEVAYGPAPDDLPWTVTSTGATTEHIVTLSGLSPNKTYYYAVGDGAQPLASGDSYFFTTPPAPGSVKATRIWVLGDSGTGDFNARNVRDAYYGYTAQRHTAFWLLLGDNAYDSGTDYEYQTKLFDMYPDMLRKSVLWPTMGNHDGLSARSATQSGPYFDIFTLPKAGEAGGAPSGTEAYYSFDYANIHVICVDSEDMMWEDLEGLKRWLQADLAATQQRWIIAFWHHPAYTRGKYDSDIASESTRVRQQIVPMLEAYGVDLVLSGHSHSYERSFLLNGHYGAASALTADMLLDRGDGRSDGAGAYVKAAGPYQGAVYVVAGSSGLLETGPMNHPAMAASLLRLGSVVIDVEGDQLDAAFLDDEGRVADKFTIIKRDAGLSTRRTAIPRHANWRYEATGRALGWAWIAPTLDDSGWPIGVAPVGYGESQVVTQAPYGPSPSQKHITTYFRHEFQLVDDPERIASLQLEANYDDGFVAYLNGAEVARRSLPPGVISFDTLANDHESGAYEPIDIAGAIGWLASGRNVLAVEVHQAWPGSSDMVMDLALSYALAQPETPPATPTPAPTATATPVATRTVVPTTSPPVRAVYLPIIVRR